MIRFKVVLALLIVHALIGTGGKTIFSDQNGEALLDVHGPQLTDKAEDAFLTDSQETVKEDVEEEDSDLEEEEEPVSVESRDSFARHDLRERLDEPLEETDTYIKQTIYRQEPAESAEDRDTARDQDILRPAEGTGHKHRHHKRVSRLPFAEAAEENGLLADGLDAPDLPVDDSEFHSIPMPTSFDAYDVIHKDNFITLEELVQVSGALENVDKAFAASDVNGDGKLSEAEFAKAPWMLQGDPEDSVRDEQDDREGAPLSEASNQAYAGNPESANQDSSEYAGKVQKESIVDRESNVQDSTNEFLT